MRCARCASPLPEGSLFCTNCGADVQDPAVTPAEALDDAGVAKLTRLLREQTAGEYEIERELARGGMGVVYVATEIQLGRRVAVKVLPPALTFGETAIERFRREARTAAALDHPNIIPIYRVGAGGELLWYSMKLLEGRSLDVILTDRQRLDLDELIAILHQVGDALDYAHQRGVVHRDVKPGNIVVDERGRVTVTDFGIAKEMRELSGSASGHPIGTPHYMSPEQYRGSEVSGAADQYSLGVVAYRCLSGRLPFDAVTAYELLHKHVSETPPPIAETRPDLPAGACAAIARALSKRPEERFATVSDFVCALAGRAPAAVSASPVPTLRALRIGWRVGIAAVAVLYAGIVLSDRPPDNTPRSETQPSPALVVLPPAIAAAIPPAPLDRPARATGRRGAVPVQAPAAILIVRVAGGWARVYVDGAPRGERPVHREALPPGTHTLSFVRPGFLPLDTIVTLHAGTNIVEVRMRPMTS